MSDRLARPGDKRGLPLPAGGHITVGGIAEWEATSGQITSP
jgi:hypothetical protein